MNLLKTESKYVNELIPNLQSAIENGKKERAKSLTNQLDALVTDTLVSKDTASKILGVSEREFVNLATDPESSIGIYNSQGKRIQSVGSESKFRFSQLSSYQKSVA